jgi:hypothetical protein
MTRNIAASVKARLLNRAKEKQEEFELFLVRFACERFLYRLSASHLRGRCTLKGAALLTLWMTDPYRATRDLDLLAAGANDEASIRAAMETICRVPCPEDGLEFDLETLELAPIRAEEKYAGQRAIVVAYLGTARIRLQVDFGFGDAVVPAAEDAEFPTLIPGLPAPRIRVHTRVATVAEKFEAMVHLGRRNSRMKDFHDVWALSEEFEFDGPSLRRAIEHTFGRRGTGWGSEVPVALTAEFYTDVDVQARWLAYRRAGAARILPPERFDRIGQRVQEFVGPVRSSILAGERAFETRWPAGGPWQSGGGPE